MSGRDGAGPAPEALDFVGLRTIDLNAVIILGLVQAD
jgi:hypothetical protein